MMIKNFIFTIVIVAVGLFGIGQPTDPLTLPLVQQSDLSIAGGFKVSDAFNYGGQGLAFNPAGPSLYLAHSR